MKRSNLFITKIAIILILSLILYFSLSDYFLNKHSYEWYSSELTFKRATSLILLNAYFSVLALTIRISAFKKLYLSLIIVGIIGWNISHFNSIFDLNLLSIASEDLLELLLFISTSIITPGLLILIAFYIKKFTSRFEGGLIGKYHLHEGLFGLILFGLGMLFFAIRTHMLQFEVFSNEFKIYLAVVMIFLYFFIFFGGFFILRDFDDIIHLKFVKKVHSSQEKLKQPSSIYNSMTFENISFFKKSKLILFPIGLIVAGFSFSMVIYSSKFIQKDVLSSEESINLGYLLSFFAGALIGYDWVRIFKRFYPLQYEEIELKIIKLQNSNT